MSAPSTFVLYNVDSPLSIALLVLSLMIAISSPLALIAEVCAINSLGYGKFVDHTKDFLVPTRIGMLFIYTPATLLFPIAVPAVGYGLDSWAFDGVTTTPRHWVLAGLFTLLFFKRVLEVSFLSKFSGKLDGVAMCMISTSYVTMGMICLLAGAEMAFLPPELNGFSVMMIIGIVVTVFGALGNLYHHVLLAKLRKPGEKHYKIPKGGLFWLTPCPHYIFEAIGWLGYSLAIGHIAAVLSLFAFTVFYLSGRTVSTLRWYRDKANQGEFDEPIPSVWKKIPFVDWSKDTTVSP